MHLSLAFPGIERGGGGGGGGPRTSELGQGWGILIPRPSVKQHIPPSPLGSLLNKNPFPLGLKWIFFKSILSNVQVWSMGKGTCGTAGLQARV